MITASTADRTFSVDQLPVRVFRNRQELGQDAAGAVADKIRELLRQQESVNIIFASAPSQNEFLATLAQAGGIDWDCIRAFHMDEYVGLPAGAPQSFGRYLKEQLFDRVGLTQAFYLDASVADAQAECERYAALLEQYPTDIVCLGIGENCHIAFNDPHVADFNDPVLVKPVELDLTSREQQVHDACFARLAEVPTHALTLTVPALMRARHAFCMVPAAHKADAISHTLTDVISAQYPSTILRLHPDATLFIDQDSARTYLATQE